MARLFGPLSLLTPRMVAEILTIGDELLIGQVLDTNATWMAERLTLMGVEVGRIVTLGDDAQVLLAELETAFQSADLVLITGGLGPTHDDVTRDVVAQYFSVPFRFDEHVFAHIKDLFSRRGRTMPERNRVQAMIPEGFQVLHNPLGTAPGLWHSFGQEGRDKVLVALPGVPHEMQGLMNSEVLPRLAQERGLRTIRHRTLLTTGIGESHLADRLGDLSPYLDAHTRLAYLPNAHGVRLRITAMGDDPAEVDARVQAFEDVLRSRAGRFIYGENGDTLEAIVGKLLRESGKTVAVAESCSGGLILHRLTNVPGSSLYVKGGIVAYCNEIKNSHLGVSCSLLEQDGAVSESVALAMARGARERFGADIGVASTGIAGPGGGTPEKPVGLVWIAYVDAAQERAVRMQFSRDRVTNKEQTATALFDLLRRHLVPEP